MGHKNNLLLILDGWGYRDTCDPSSCNYNALAAARTPHWNKLLKQYPNRLIDSMGLPVGLPANQMGNSEVGHMNIGAGRVIYQTLTRIDKDILEGTFLQNKELAKLIAALKESGGTLHLTGLLSDGGIHSHINHILEVLKPIDAAGVKTRIHVITDGRDTAPSVAESFLSQLDSTIKNLKHATIASVVGRYFAMDRDKRWDRVEAAYNACFQGIGERYDSWQAAVSAARARGEGDEFIKPSVVGAPTAIQNGDGFLFMNFRSDRARELSLALLDPTFEGFKRPQVSLAAATTLTPYIDRLPAAAMYTSDDIKNGLGEWLAKNGKTQLRIAETEKYPHVTFFFNGGVETPSEGEERILIPSPKVATYDLQPEMSLPEVTDRLVEALQSKKFDAIICNFANGDMVGHTGQMPAAMSAAEAVDKSLGRLMEVLDKTDGQMIVTADHGNLEKMWDEEANCPMTAHTFGPVWACYYGKRTVTPRGGSGALCDLAPTLLSLMDMEIPAEMTGKPLFTF